MLVEVAVPVPLAQAFTYALPAHLGDVVPGSRVAVPFGPRRVVGVVLGKRATAPPGFAIKDVLAVVDAEPVVPEELLSFLVELGAYYLAPIGEVLALALPVLDRAASKRLEEHLPEKERRAVGRLVRWVAPTAKVEHGAEVSPARARVLAFVRAHGDVSRAAVLKAFPSGAAHVDRLVADGFLASTERETPRGRLFDDAVPREPRKEPTDEQVVALEAIEGALERRERKGFLLWGVTGSGKTEVYLRAIERAAEGGRGAMVLVPEIALTPQLVSRYRARFGDEVAIMHSGLKPTERRAMWEALRSGRVRVVIGARSALFAPVVDLGLVIVDEEHEPSFKQEEGVRYHARDMALLRAHRAGAVCVLGSATPSLEAVHLGRTGKVTVLRLVSRARREAELPEVQVVDLRRTGAPPGVDPRLSLPLHRRMSETLARKEQTVLFLNRRGFAPAVLCEDCGHIARCRSCSVALTFHRKHGGILQCHHCDHEEPFSRRCERCGSERLELGGQGTERLEESVSQAFPEARVGRLDRDVGGGVRAEAVLSKLRRGELDVLVGTQMVAKGHDVPSVTLVGVVDADGALSMPDFRASERAFHLLVQVAGRAGRGDRKGTVVLQTRNPEHPAVVFARTHDVASFIESELAAREELAFPPFTRMVLVRIDGEDERATMRAAAALAQVAQRSGPSGRGEVLVRGPSPAPIARVKRRYRFQLAMRGRSRAALREVAVAILAARRDVPRGVRVVVDVDPVSML